MSGNVPFVNHFNDVEKNEKYKDNILYASVIATAITLGIDFIPHFFFTDTVSILLNSLLCLMAVAYFVFDIIANQVFKMAEEKRRDDLFDNSLNTKISEVQSQGYFSNEAINPGIVKLGVNTWENSLFSKTISEKMLRPMIIKSIIVVFLFLCLALFANNKIFATLLQLALPYTILTQTYRLYFYNKGMVNSFKKFQSIFSTAKVKDRQNIILHTVVNHEATQAWACIKLNSSIFNEINPALSIKWEEIKQKYDIT